MNRGVLVTRGDPDVDELVISAEGICHNKKKNTVKKRLSTYFPLLAKAYKRVCERQTRQFFGLRDFYRYYIAILQIHTPFVMPGV